MNSEYVSTECQSTVGDEAARQKQLADALVPSLHRELRQLAHQQMRNERVGHTLQTTALINEAYMRLAKAGVEWQSEAHFLAVAATVMRRLLIDHAKGRKRAKRGGAHAHIPIDDLVIDSEESLDALLLLDSALIRLEEFDQRKSRLLELHYFAGLEYGECARIMEVSPATVGRELRLAKAWLKRELADTVE